MIAGGVVCAVAFAIAAIDPPWQVQFAAFVMMGIGFYLLHGCIQVEASELSTTSRGTAMSLHSLFFFMGHSAGPVLYGIGFAYLGASPSVLLGGLLMLITGLMCARFLRRRRGDV